MAKRVKFTELTENMFIAKDIYADELLIIPAHSKITPRIAAKLELYDILSVDVYTEEESLGESYLESVKQSEDFQKFNKHYDEIAFDMRGQFNQILTQHSEVDVKRLMSQVDDLLGQSTNSYHMFDMLHCMRDYDDSTFAHCVNVSIISSMLARWLKFSEEDIAMAALAGLLHDIGKLRVPEHILNKPEKLTTEEFDIIKKHTINGYEILKDKQLDLRVKLATIEHHERCDGTGYPFKKKGYEIQNFSKIVSIADVYDAMTAKRVYRDALCPFEVIEIFEQDGVRKYETKYLLTFLQEIANTYINNRVTLNDGTQGEIILFNSRELSRPLVKTRAGFVDLSQKRNLKITALM